MEEKLMLERDKYKLFLLRIKIIPMCMAFIFFINTLFSCFGIEIKAFNYIACIGYLPLFILYDISYILHFCEYHRIFLHYVLIINTINLYNIYIGIPIDNYDFLKIHIAITAVCLFLVLYFKKIRK